MTDDLTLVRLGTMAKWDVGYAGVPLGRIQIDRKEHLVGHEGWYLSFRYMRETLEDDVMIKLGIKRACRASNHQLIYAEVDPSDAQKENILMRAGFSEVIASDDIPQTVLVWSRT